MVESLEGSQRAKKRLEVVLDTIAGKLSVAEACLALGVGKTAFYQMRYKVMQAALEDLEPKPSGRPPRQVPEEQAEVERLRRENRELLDRLEIAHVREELMLAMPDVFEPAQKKKRQSTAAKKQQQVKRRKRKKQREMKKKSRKR